MVRVRPAVAALAVAAITVLAVATGAVASSPNELLRGVRAARDTSRALADAGWDSAKEGALVDRIDDLCDVYHELAADNASLRQTSGELLTLITDTRARYTRVLEAMQAEVIRVDGDLEAAQDSAAWREREVLAMRLQYRANWVRFETAMRYEQNDARRKSLLRQARDGFGEFLGSGDAALDAESLYGRGLASKTLREYKSAAADLAQVVQITKDPAMAQRTRIALAETRLAGGDIDGALRETQKLVSAGGSGEARRQALFLRTKALLLSVSRYKLNADTARARRREAAKALETLYKSGSYWKTKAVQLIDAGITDPEAWASDGGSPFVTWLVAESLRRRGQCAPARNLYATLERVGAFVVESAYGDGFCLFHDGEHEAALDSLERYLAATEAGGHTYRPQAAYLTFKSGEALSLAGKLEGERFKALAERFLELAPDHDNRFEAWYRLGEIYERDQDYERCADAFGRVDGDPSFTLKAHYLAADCGTRTVLNAPVDVEIPDEQVRAALAAVDTFLEKVTAHRSVTEGDASDGLIAPLESKAVVMGAALAGRLGDDGMRERIARLSGFEERFPSEQQLVSEVRSLRVVAYRRLGNLAAAGDEITALLDDPQANLGEVRLGKLGLAFLKEGAALSDIGDEPGAQRARKVALVIYERMLDDAMAAGRTDPGLADLVADLRTELKTRP